MLKNYILILRVIPGLLMMFVSEVSRQERGRHGTHDRCRGETVVI